MKISSVSKKVLASALSAAMVVAFAPTVAFGGTDLGGNSSTAAGSSPVVTAPAGAVAQVTWTKDSTDYVEFFGPDATDTTHTDEEKAETALQDALKYAGAVDAKANTVKVTLLENNAGDFAVYGAITLDLNGKTLTNKSNWDRSTATWDGNIAALDAATLSFGAGPAAVSTGKTVNEFTKLGTMVDSGNYAGYWKLSSDQSANQTETDTKKKDANGKWYSKMLNAGNTVAGGDYFAHAEKTTGALSAVTGTSLTIVDSSEAKTGVVSGNAAARTGSDGKEYGAYSGFAIYAAAGKTLNINGGKITSGSSAYAYNDIITVSAAGATVAVKDATIEAVTGKGYESPVVGASTTVRNATALGAAPTSIKNAKITATASDEIIVKTASTSDDVSATASAVTSAGSVEGSTIAASGATATGLTATGKVKTSNITAAGVKAATALTTSGAVEGTTVKATVGDAVDQNATTKVDGYAPAAKAIVANGTASVTYKKISVEATAGKKATDNQTSALGIDASGVTETKPVVVESGTVIGDLYADAATETNELQLQGGEYSYHTGDFVTTNYRAICTKGEGNDYVTYDTDVDYNDNDTDATTETVTDGLKNAAQIAVEGVYDAIITGKNTAEVAYTLPNKTAEEVRALLLDGATNKYFSAGVDVMYGGEAKATTGLTGDNLAKVEAFNKTVAAVDEAAKADAKAAFAYIVPELKISYLNTATAQAGDKPLTIAPISDLGKKFTTDATGNNSHGTGATATVSAKDNTFKIVPTAIGGDFVKGTIGALTTATKSAASLVAIDGTAIAEIEATLDANKNKQYVATGMDKVFSVLAANGESATEKPETPSVEKATQSIDVAKKSRTLTLKKGTTKTQKARYFKLGASAETELAIAKKSGSSRITVSGQKVTLKKGTKKGTFTAKVSIKAAASDSYLAAAKTITVKFVVKK